MHSISLGVSTDILVLDVLGMPSVRSLITLASCLYSMRYQSLTFWKTNKECTEKLESIAFPQPQCAMKLGSHQELETTLGEALGFQMDSSDQNSLGMHLLYINEDF